MATKYVKVIRGSIEIPVLDGDGNQMPWPQKITISEGELADLPADLADRLVLLGAVEILPS
jgi:hypothetical protein